MSRGGLDALTADWLSPSLWPRARRHERRD